MIRKTAAITAASIAGVVLAGSAAVGANIGILDAADDTGLGTLSAEAAISAPAEPSTTTAPSTTVPPSTAMPADASDDSEASRPSPSTPPAPSTSRPTTRACT